MCSRTPNGEPYKNTSEAIALVRRSEVLKGIDQEGCQMIPFLADKSTALTKGRCAVTRNC